MTNSIEFQAGEPDLVSQVIASDEQTSSEIDLALTWRELIQGSSIVIGSFFSEARCGLLLSSQQRRDKPLSGRRLEILYVGSGRTA